MSPPLVVPDASVILKWALASEDEGDRDRALALRDTWLAGKCRVYHAVAINHGGTLVTADASLLRKASRTGRAVLLRSWKP